jgi:hypothetical protein
MWRDVDPDKVSALQSNDDEDIEQVEANGRCNEQVHGGDVRRMVTSPDFDQTKYSQAKSRIFQALGDIDCDVFIEMDR